MGPYSDYTLLERHRLLHQRVHTLEGMVRAYGMEVERTVEPSEVDWDFYQRLRGRSHPLQGWQGKLSALEDEAPLELSPGTSLIQPFTFHQQICHQT